VGFKHSIFSRKGLEMKEGIAVWFKYCICFKKCLPQPPSEPANSIGYLFIPR
jgi:hypothetical protein